MVINVPRGVLLIPALHMNYTLINSMFMCCFSLLLALKLCKDKHMSNIFQIKLTHPLWACLSIALHNKHNTIKSFGSLQNKQWFTLFQTKYWDSISFNRFF